MDTLLTLLCAAGLTFLIGVRSGRYHAQLPEHLVP